MAEFLKVTIDCAADDGALEVAEGGHNFLTLRTEPDAVHLNRSSARVLLSILAVWLEAEEGDDE